MADEFVAANDHSFHGKVVVDVTHAEGNEGVADGAVTPGTVLIKGAAANDLKVAGAGAANAIGWAPDNLGDGTSTDATAKKLTDDFADNSRMPYFTAGGVFFGILLDGESIVQGDILKTAAGGKLAKIAAADSPALKVCEYIGIDDQAPSGSDARIMVRWVK
jgi:hypothetical protein